MKTNIELVEYCKGALLEKWYYGWGSYGLPATREYIDSLVRQYPSMNNSRKSYMLGAVGKTKLSDCYGLVKGFLSVDDGVLKFKSKYDTNTGGAFARANEKGTINTLPDIVGTILYMNGHVGVYIGNGEFIECADYVGVVKGKIQNGRIVSGSKFTHWFKEINIEYLDTGKSFEIEPMKVISNETKEGVVYTVEKIKFLLNGADVELNGIFHNNSNYISLRELAEKLGYIVEYDDDKKLPILTN